MAKTGVDTKIKVVPANKASWEDLESILGKSTCYDDLCYCQRFKIISDWKTVSDEQRAERLREQTQCDHPRSRRTSGLVGYLDGKPVAWCAVEPRPAYTRLLTTRIPWIRPGEDESDERIWAVTCFVVRTGYRKRGLMYAMARAAVDFAKARGAKAVESYPMITYKDKVITWGELHVGSRKVMASVGFKQVSQPTKRRFVMRIDF
jgi:GNAT superfamily N-acetyltransferase